MLSFSFNVPMALLSVGVLLAIAFAIVVQVNTNGLKPILEQASTTQADLLARGLEIYLKLCLQNPLSWTFTFHRTRINTNESRSVALVGDEGTPPVAPATVPADTKGLSMVTVSKESCIEPFTTETATVSITTKSQKQHIIKQQPAVALKQYPEPPTRIISIPTSRQHARKKSLPRVQTLLSIVEEEKIPEIIPFPARKSRVQQQALKPLLGGRLKNGKCGRAAVPVVNFAKTLALSKTMTKYWSDNNFKNAREKWHNNPQMFSLLSATHREAFMRAQNQYYYRQYKERREAETHWQELWAEGSSDDEFWH